jgi:hypothetical protein
MKTYGFIVNSKMGNIQFLAFNFKTPKDATHHLALMLNNDQNNSVQFLGQLDYLIIDPKIFITRP